MGRRIFVSLEVAVESDFEGDPADIAEAVFDHACKIDDVPGLESIDSFDYTIGADG